MQEAEKPYKVLLVGLLFFFVALPANATDLTPVVDPDAEIDMLKLTAWDNVPLGFSPTLVAANRIRYTAPVQRVAKVKPTKSAFQKYWEWRADRHRRIVRIRPMMIMPLGNGYRVF